MARKSPPQGDLTQAIQQALHCHRQGRLGEAEHLYRAILGQVPHQFEALHFLGLLKMQQGNSADALDLLSAAVKTKPYSREALASLAGVLASLDRHAEALANYDRILRIKTDDAEAHYNRGVVLAKLDRDREALASFDKALAIAPGNVPTLFNRASLLAMAERHAEALAGYDKLLAIAPHHVDALNNRGNVLARLGRHDEALASYDRVLAADPRYPNALNNRANALKDLRRHDEALASYDQVLAVAPDHVDALYNRGKLLIERNAPEEALASLDKALSIAPDNADALHDRGMALSKLQRFAEAIASYERVRTIEPDHRYALAGLAHCHLTACNWTAVAALADELRTRLSDGQSFIDPLTLLALDSAPADQLNCARNFVRNMIPQPPRPLSGRGLDGSGRIRVAYLSADFHRHPVGYLSADLYGLHDRARFEIIGIGLGPDDASEIRSRIVKSFDRWHDARSDADRDVARRLSDLKVHIAVDLNGHTQGGRPGILAHRPAPVQASYLGFAGTTGAEFIDYVIADEIALPAHQQPFYTERIARLPDCFLVSSRRSISQRVPGRREALLPEEGLVLCAFNQTFKISAPVFDIWMRLLRAAAGSVLWLSSASSLAQDNLRREAAARGVAPARLIFAPRVELLEDHLARLRQADLFLDTLPYNAHTTANDALWAGLPVLTCAGTTFAGRVGASLLHAVGLPELVASSLADYEALAQKLIADPALRQSIRRRLDDNRLTCPLFDTRRFTRHLEAAYTTMWETYRRGEAPQSFSVDPGRSPAA